MTHSTPADVRMRDASGSPGAISSQVPLSLPTILALSAWSGLVAGLLEVVAIIFRRRFFDADQILRMSHHFVWLIPLINLCVFIAFAIMGSALARISPQRGRWLFVRLLTALTFFPTLLAAFPKIYSGALLLIASGIAMRTVPIIERNRCRLRPFLLPGYPAPFIIVAILGGSIWFADHSKQVAENARPLPPKGSPNVILMVLDTVAASHSSVNGYQRATTNTLTELATRGIRFDYARSTAPWTLPSHASMFTGRYLHELQLGWLTPFDNQQPTVAEFLGSQGYATAGFIANTWYCGASTGLARGFTRYEDYVFPNLTALKACSIIGRPLENYEVLLHVAEDTLKYFGCLNSVKLVHQWLDDNRKDAAEVNRELLDWLATRDQPDRPFFAFLNYFDAHYRYVLKPGRLRRFGVEPDDEYKRILIDHWGNMDKSAVSPSGVAFAADSYDDCIADQDEQIGKLIDTLDNRATLDNTWLIVVADHGESFGEHPNIFCHGTSLFDTELRVPLLVIPPSKTKAAAGLVIRDPASLRDIAATIVDMAGLKAVSSFPGDSLARFWTNQSPATRRVEPASLSELVPNDPKNRDYWGLPAPLPPRASLKDAQWSYMRREVEVGEQLYRLTEDAGEQRNIAPDSTVQDILTKLRANLDQRTNGPLLPDRFFR